jgi:hypothetical protein
MKIAQGQSNRDGASGIDEAMVGATEDPMRIILAAAVTLCLTGCSDTNFFGESSGSSSPPPQASAPAAAPAPVAAAPESAPPSAAAEAAPLSAAPAAQPGVQQMASPEAGPHCTEIAKLRARDAAYAGEDSDTQDSVYHRTYAECMAWDARHRS